MLGQGDLTNVTVFNVMTTFRNTDDGDTPEEKGLEALVNYFDMGHGKAEAIQDCINRQETDITVTSELDEDRLRGEDARLLAYPHFSLVRARDRCAEGDPADNRCDMERGSSR